MNNWNIQKAIYQLLTGDAALMALVTGIYDRVPERTAYPYLTLGENISREWSSKTTHGARSTFALHAFSREGGTRQAAAILAKVRELLHDRPLTVEGHAVISMRCTETLFFKEPDGVTTHAVLRLTLLSHAA